MAEEIKYKNIIGTGLTDYVQKQINYRKKVTRGNKDTNRRSSKELQWLTNRNAWIRLSSGAEFNPSPNIIRYKEQKLNDDFLALGNLIEDRSVRSPNIEDVAKLNEGYTNDLAKKYILQGGTLKNGKRRTTFKDTYPKGNYDDDGNFLGTEASIKGIKDDLGYRPLPGITNLTVGTREKWQTTLEADVDFICYNLEQLEIMDHLYMSLGVHVFLEWGHTPYINSSGNIIESFNPIDFFSNDFKDKKKLIQEIENKKKEHHGNYGAFLGRVSNFSYVADVDGTYKCQISIIGSGGILESLRINTNRQYDFDFSTKDNESTKYDSDLANVLTSIKNFLKKSGVSLGEIKSTFSSNGLNPTKEKSVSENVFGRLDSSKYFTKKIADVNTSKLFGYGDLLSKIYGSCTYKGYDFKDNGSSPLTFPNGNDSFAAYGNAWQYVSNLAKNIPGGNGTDNLTPINVDLFDGFATQFIKGGKRNQTSVLGTSVMKDDDQVVDYYYIKFGHLLALIQHLCIFTENQGNIIIDNNSSSKNSISPIVYIDFHPDNTIMKTGVLEASSNPAVCMVPLRINTKGNESPNEAFDKFFTPLDTRKTKLYKWQEGSKTNESKNLIVNDSLNKINKVLGDSIDGKLMNVLINIDFAIGSLISLENRNQEVDLLSYINTILDGISLSLGKINNFRAFFDDCSNVVRIVDEHKTENFENELLTIPNFGLDSITYDYTFGSSISPSLATQVVIGAQGENGVKTFPEDILSFQKINNKVRDKFAPTKLSPLLPAISSPSTNNIINLKSAQKLFDHLYYIYTLDEIVDSATIFNLSKSFNDTSNIQQKYYKDKNATLLMPLVITVRLDGISGVLPYNAFLLPENRLPLRYQGNKIAFIILSLDHIFENNQWFTSFRGLIINREGNNVTDDRPKNPGINRPPDITRTPQQPLETTTYGGKLDLPYPSGDFTQPKSEPKAQPEPEDTSTVQPPNNTTPTGDSRPSFSPVQVDPQPASIPTDIVKARDFIISNEVPGGVPELTAYKDDDYTVSSGFTYRIGFGSDTITSTTGGVRRVKEGDTITTEQAYLDIERRLKTEFKSKVVATCDSNGVNYDSLPSPVKTVFIDCAYNYGSLWNSIVISYRDGGVPGLIAELQRRANRGPSQVPRRREAEIRHLGG
jgi:hypothetical protein